MYYLLYIYCIIYNYILLLPGEKINIYIYIYIYNYTAIILMKGIKKEGKKKRGSEGWRKVKREREKERERERERESERKREKDRNKMFVREER